ncbi:MAG: hypothetical protein RQ842_02105 [Vulcanisaeta sp.]|jgi:hypothetical protein|nr:hypothetical protein [Vulcanisaeta sp.]
MPAPKINEALIEVARNVMIGWVVDDTKTVLSMDEIDNLRKILAGEKVVVIVDREYSAVIKDENSDTIFFTRLNNLPLTTIAGAIHWLRMHAVSHEIRYGEETFVITSKEARDYLARLAVLAKMAKALRGMLDILHEVGEARLRDLDDLLTDALTRNCDPTDIQCLIGNAWRLRGDIRKGAVRAVERKVGAIRKLVQRHNFIVEHMQLPLESIKWVREEEVENKSRMDEYFRTYPSYIEYNGETARFALSDTVLLKPIVAMPIITGVNAGPRFVRFVLNIVTLRKYTPHFTCDGSWMLGIDKTTNQPFAISLPRNCLHMPIQVCIEYILRLRNTRLRPTTNTDKNNIKIIEV